MNLELTYIFECPGGFKYVRNTPQEIIKVFKENLEALKMNAKECKQIKDIYSFLDEHKYMPIGYIEFWINDKYMRYELRTEVKQL